MRSEHCQSTMLFRSRQWKWPRLADDGLPPSPEKNQQAKTHKTQVWPRKAERSECDGNLPSYDGREVCISHHHELWGKKTWIQWSLSSTQQWLKQRVRSTENIVRRKTLGCRRIFFICAAKGQNWERKDLNLKDLRNTRKWTTSRKGKRQKKTG